MIQLQKYQLEEMLTSAAKLGASMVVISLGIDKTAISKNEAYNRYSRRLVDTWIKTGKVKAVKQNNRILLSVAELESVSVVNDLFEKHAG